MTINNSEVLSLTEVKKLLEEQQKQMKDEKEEKQEKLESTLSYSKKFSKLSMEKLKSIKEELKKLDIIQLKDKIMVKIADLLPADAEDLLKIISGEGISLDKNEIDKILGVCKKYTK